jgi:TldD protein
MLVPPFDRRGFLKGLGSVMAAVAVPPPLLARLGRFWEPVPPIQDPRLRDLTGRALDAARAAGAAYADVRLTHTRERGFNTVQSTDGEAMDVGVRTLVNGYWGFASSPIWSPDEMGRLGREAVHQARANSLGEPREVDLAPVGAVPDGHWVMPVQTDPFEVSPLEIRDYLNGLALFASRSPRVSLRIRPSLAGADASFQVQEKAFASSVGTYCTQRLYQSSGTILVVMEFEGQRLVRELFCLDPAGLGWELFTADRIPRVRDYSLREEIRRSVEAIEEDRRLPVKPVEVGRYDAVFNAKSMTTMVSGTLLRSSELDRALGYEANAGGTTYITDPLRMLGTEQVAAPMLTLTADRAMPGGCASVQWDDEGVVPDEATLVKAGVLNDFQTTRESAGWLKARYSALGRPWRSHGCANAPSAIAPPMQFSANLAIAPGNEALDYEGLVAGMTKGIAIEDVPDVDMDFQASSGEGGGAIYKIERGKKVARIASAAFVFRATQFWKSLRALGGEASLRRYSGPDPKGEPVQRTLCSVTAPPGAVNQISLIDKGRKM